MLQTKNLHKFEAASLANLCPDNYEEAKALIPSLEDKFDDEELNELLEDLKTFKDLTQWTFVLERLCILSCFYYPEVYTRWYEAETGLLQSWLLLWLEKNQETGEVVEFVTQPFCVSCQVWHIALTHGIAFSLWKVLLFLLYGMRGAAVEGFSAHLSSFNLTRAANWINRRWSLSALLYRMAHWYDLWCTVILLILPI